jgi:hypothetical protein
MSQNTSSETKEMSTHEFIYWIVCILVCLTSLCAYEHQREINLFFFNQYETFWRLVYAAFISVVVLAIYFYKKETKSLTDRVRFLKQVWSHHSGLWVGNTKDGVGIYLPKLIRLGHTQIVGATGRGKTKSVILPWIGRDLYAGYSPVVIDGKGDPALARDIQRIANLVKKDDEPKITVFDLGNPKTSCTTNPLATGSAQQVTDRLFTAFTFLDPFYKAIQYDTARLVIELIQEVQGEVTFRNLFEALTQDALLTSLTSKSENEKRAASLTRHLSIPRKERNQNLAGLLSQLGPFAEGEIAPLVNGEVEGKEYLNLSQMLLAEDLNQESERRPGKRIFILLIPTLLYQELGHQLGKLLLQELGWAVGERASKGTELGFTPVFLDEFSAFVYPNFVQILNKARSTGVALHLSHQSISDLSSVSPDFAKSINTNTNIKCLMGLNDPETAEFFANHLGTETGEKITERASAGLWGRNKKSGDLSVREVESYKIHPNRLKNYTRGRGVIHFPTELGNLTEEIQFETL